MLALLFQLKARTAADDLAQTVEKAFPQYPDADVILSFPGLGVQPKARGLPGWAKTEITSPRPAA